MSNTKPLGSPQTPSSPASPTLLPPRKSVELEDSGARELESDDEDIFSDARDTLASPSASAVPLTRVEKVDGEPSHGQVPGTKAYEKRTQDAVPDEVAIIPEGTSSNTSSRRGSQAPAPGKVAVPYTVVEKIDPEKPSHGDIPGTDAHEKRKADAVPDSIVRSGKESPFSSHGSSPSIESIPKTVVTRVDSEPSHGEVPGRGTPKESFFSPMNIGFHHGVPSSIAADGGFGPMEYDDSEGSESDEKNLGSKSMPEASQFEGTAETNEDVPTDDFDDFEEGAEGEDFGDFGEDEDEDEPAESRSIDLAMPVSIPPFEIPDLSDSALDQIITVTSDYLDELYPTTTNESQRGLPSLPESSSLFLSDRSRSLWSQLVAPPPLQPPNWVRSRIRRLFLVSLGVPVDLDEILPASKQKKLVLQYTSPDGPGSATTARLRSDADAASDSAASSKATRTKRRKGPAPPPEFNILTIKALCATTVEAIQGMSDRELKAHVEKLDEMVATGREVLQYWVDRKDAAVSEKEAFDGVIENLVQHARRTRK